MPGTGASFLGVYTASVSIWLVMVRLTKEPGGPNISLRTSAIPSAWTDLCDQDASVCLRGCARAIIAHSSVCDLGPYV